jgi:hypothetical protein
MRAARLAVKCARKARAALQRGDVSMAIRLIAAAGTQVGLTIAAAPPAHLTALGYARAYMRASNCVHHVLGEIVSVAGGMCAVVLRAPGALQ